MFSSKENLIKKIQRLPEDQRKIILWVSLFFIIIAVCFFFLWSTKKKMRDFEPQELEMANFPDFSEIEENKKELREDIEELKADLN